MRIVPIVGLVALLDTKMTREVIDLEMFVQLVLVKEQFVAILRGGTKRRTSRRTSRRTRTTRKRRKRKRKRRTSSRTRTTRKRRKRKRRRMSRS